MKTPDTMVVPRRADIDWLRIGAVLLLVPFHTARVFDTWEPFYAKSPETSLEMAILFIATCGAWHMPLLFLLAGASSWPALGVRGGGGYLRERTRRLLLPLVFCVLVVVAPQSYFGALTHGNFSGGYLEWYPRQFLALGPDGDLSGYKGGFTPGHLWFVLFLYVYACLSLPLLLWLRGDAGRRFTAALAKWVEKPGRFWLMPVSLMLAQALPDIGGKNIPYYLIFFLTGYVLLSEPGLEEAADRRKKPALIAGIVSLVAVLAAWYLKAHRTYGLEIPFAILYEGVAAWCLVVAALGYGKGLRNYRPPWLRHLAEGAYPFYILHQTVIIIIAYQVVQWGLNIWLAFCLIVALSCMATAGLYWCGVRPFNGTRLLFGMKPKP